MSDENRQLNLPQREEKILEFWEKNKIFEKSLECGMLKVEGRKTKRKLHSTLHTPHPKTFVFYEGPPTANAGPHIGHIESRAFKDIIPRYKTMRGFFVPRKAGWDTHGLPVEIQVEKLLGLKTKKDIEKYGVAQFNEKCRESVWQFKEEWEKSTKRIGFWLDLENPYITYETKYIESLWWIIKEIWKKKLLYQDFKVVPWCPRCQTGLSSHEVGQGYKKVKENSIYVKLKIKNQQPTTNNLQHPSESLLVWTTTPWTLPGNVAIAVNPKIEYTKYKINRQLTTYNLQQSYEHVWSATVPPHEIGEEIEVVERASGKSLLGTKYEPLFKIPKEYSLGSEPEYKVIAGSFVSTEEGTGMVHLAPAFGEEDMQALKTQSTKSKLQTKPKTQNPKPKNEYPILHTVNENGTMKKGIIGEGKFVKEADKNIVEDLKKRELLYAIKPYEHDYPHCWRCQTPLLYFAKNAWWIKMTSLKEKLLSNNSKINWMPEHIKEGRFGEFLREVRDWAFSRERFWGTPLPVWKCDKCEHVDAVGSLEELHKKSGGEKNKYIVMRHGESFSNVNNLCGSIDGHPLTLKGRTEAEKSAKTLRKANIDLIVSSPVLRTRETAEIFGKTLGLKVHFDKRIQEINVGDFQNRPDHMYHQYFSSHLEKFTKRPPNGETLSELRRRVMDFIFDMERKYSGKTILIVSHEYPVWMMFSGALGWSNEETIRAHTGEREDDFIFFAEALELSYLNLPRDNTGAVNLHRPFIDKVTFSCSKCGGKMKRVSEVIDVWFDSGAMPLAQAHYPFAFAADRRRLNADSCGQDTNAFLRNSALGLRHSALQYNLQYPADYIAEAVDQTRGWFYTLLAVATLLGKSAPYKNVISLGHVLDKNGQKMSKSKGNVVVPKEMIDKYGADTIRWYFYTINSPGEPKKFDEKDLQNKLRGFLGTLWNSFVFFDTYVDKSTTNNQNSPPRRIPGLRPLKAKQLASNPTTNNLLDKWILAKLNILTSEATKKLDKYDITGAGRLIEEFTLNDFSNWYLRRSRRRFKKPQSKNEKEEAVETTANVLMTLVKITAPFVPFVSDVIWQELRKKLGVKEESVHLSSWPEFESRIKNQESGILKDMEVVRKIVTEALKQRAEAGIKVRQPLANLQIVKFSTSSNNNTLRAESRSYTNELFELIKEEVNVKEITFGKELKLYTTITSELKEEGMIREIVRNIQEMRRDLGLHPRDKIRAHFSSTLEIDAILEKWKKFIMAEAGAAEFSIGGKKLFKAERDLEIDGNQIWAGIAPR